ncbi:hypothetical protein SAMN05720470_106183 [Fibrobacter sp. UWOV1]|jgi:predicted nucleic acid-binding protein|nr:hypothetical protein SAMN05720470_106183 [Fibrobacter sp. UWOV1]
MIVVSDTTPLISLLKIRRLDLLESLHMALDAKINYINDVKREKYGVRRKHTTDIP